MTRLFPSLDVYNNDSISPGKQKQNETYIKKLQTKVVGSIIFVIHCSPFIQYTLSLPKFSVKTSFEKA